MEAVFSGWASREAFEGGAKTLGQLLGRAGQEIPKPVGFEPEPQAFDGIEVRRIGRKCHMWHLRSFRQSSTFSCSPHLCSGEWNESGLTGRNNLIPGFPVLNTAHGCDVPKWAWRIRSRTQKSLNSAKADYDNNRRPTVVNVPTDGMEPENSSPVMQVIRPAPSALSNSNVQTGAPFLFGFGSSVACVVTVPENFVLIREHTTE